MKKRHLLLVPALLMTSTMANAEIEFSGFLTGTNNFMYRGLSLSANSAAMQGQVSAQTESGFYATLWGSNTKLGTGPGRDGPGLEGNFLLGFTNNITEDVAYDVGYLRTFYPGVKSVDGNKLDFNDFYGTLMYKGFSVGFSYSDDFFAETGSAMYTFASYNAPIYNDLSLIATAGYTRNKSKEFLGLFGVDKKGWAHYELGLSHPLPHDFEIAGSYHWTTGQVKRGFDISGFGTNRFVIGLTKNF